MRNFRLPEKQDRVREGEIEIERKRERERRRERKIEISPKVFGEMLIKRWMGDREEG